MDCGWNWWGYNRDCGLPWLLLLRMLRWWLLLRWLDRYFGWLILHVVVVAVVAVEVVVTAPLLVDDDDGIDAVDHSLPQAMMILPPHYHQQHQHVVMTIEQ